MLPVIVGGVAISTLKKESDGSYSVPARCGEMARDGPRSPSQMARGGARWRELTRGDAGTQVPLDLYVLAFGSVNNIFAAFKGSENHRARA